MTKVAAGKERVKYNYCIDAINKHLLNETWAGCQTEKNKIITSGWSSSMVKMYIIKQLQGAGQTQWSKCV